MKTLAAFAGAVALLSLPTLASAMTDAECTAAWTAADANKDGVLTEAEGRRYFASMRVASKPIADGKITQAIFTENCKAGLFNPAKAEAGAPLPGSNSFTEGQAQDRAMAAGFSNVSPLKKDDKGVWRGTGSDGAKNVNIGVDFKGNVVAN